MDYPTLLRDLHWTPLGWSWYRSLGTVELHTDQFGCPSNPIINLVLVCVVPLIGFVCDSMLSKLLWLVAACVVQSAEARPTEASRRDEHRLVRWQG